MTLSLLVINLIMEPDDLERMLLANNDKFQDILNEKIFSRRRRNEV
ncbi:MAG TPA: hypothetical protein V6C58_09200 [Allocoleopsis sp.]